MIFMIIMIIGWVVCAFLILAYNVWKHYDSIKTYVPVDTSDLIMVNLMLVVFSTIWPVVLSFAIFIGIIALPAYGFFWGSKKLARVLFDYLENRNKVVDNPMKPSTFYRT